MSTIGFAWTYTLDVALFLVGFWGIISLPSIPPTKSSPIGIHSLIEDLSFLRRSKNLRTVITLHVATFTFGRSYAIFPAVVALVIGGGAWTVGVLTASGAVGVVVSSILSGSFGATRRHVLAIVWASVTMTSFIAALGIYIWFLDSKIPEYDRYTANIPTLILLCFINSLVGSSDNISKIFRTTIMQSATPDHYRGQLQGIYTLVLSAGPRLGDTYAGFLAALTTLWFPQLLGALLILVLAGLYLRLRPGFRHYDGANPVP